MAIARNSSADLGLVNPVTGGGTYTAAYTCGSGANRLLIVVAFGDTSDTLNATAPTYAGVNMTLVAKVVATGDRWLYMWYLVNPASGANNVVISSPTTTAIAAMAADYTGVKQTVQPDASNTNSNASATVISTAVTVVNANCWIMAVQRESAGLAESWTNATELHAANGIHHADSNGTVGTGSVTITADSAPNATGLKMSIIAASFQPDTGGGGGTNWGPSLLSHSWNRIVQHG
jgi:hypothetical protein